MSITKRSILSKLYADFHQEIKQHIDVSSIFPDHEETDLVDIVYLINYYFGATDNYEPIIKDLIELNKLTVNSETLNKILPIINNFLTNFKKV